MEVRTTRFSGAQWADQLYMVGLVGCGGIGSWTALNLGRIGHDLVLIDPDTVDETNVQGGQMFMVAQVGGSKVHAVAQTCRAFGCQGSIDALADFVTPQSLDGINIVLCGLDNMKARKEVFAIWKATCEKASENEQKAAVLIDGRLTMEMYEIFTIPFSRKDLLERYEKNHLFDDGQAQVLDCTTKQSTFAAMGIAGAITATLCNHLTNVKMGEEFSSVEFYQRMYYPVQIYTTEPPVENNETCQETQVQTQPVAEAVAELAE